MRLKDISVGSRLTLAFSTTLVGLLLIAAVGWWTTNSLFQTIDNIYQDDKLAEAELGNISTALLRYRNQMIQIIGTKSEDDFETLATDLPGLRTALNGALLAYQQREKRLSFTHNEGAEFNAVEAALKEYFALEQRTLDRMRAALAAADLKEAERLRQAAIQNSFYAAGPSMNAAGESLSRLFGTVSAFAAQSREDSSHKRQLFHFVMLAVVMACLAITAILVWTITRSVTAPLHLVNQALARVSAGDLTTRMEYESRDELGEVCANVNHLIDQLTKLLGQFIQSSQTMEASASQLAFVVEKVTAASDTQASHASGAADFVNNMASDTLRMSGNAKSVASQALDTKTAATDGSQAVSRTITGMQSVFDTMHTAEATIQSLSATSKEIGTIATVIDDIADQTNLLALNAAIEAARAGEQGRGFAVVADEVRKLAERTSRATKEIGSMLKIIQKDTTSAIDSMSGSSTQVAEGKTLVDQAGAHLTSIVESVGQVTAHIQDIAQQAEGQAAAGTIMSQTINDLAAMGQQHKSLVAGMFGQAMTLMTTATELKKSISVFQLKKPASAATDDFSAVQLF